MFYIVPRTLLKHFFVTLTLMFLNVHIKIFVTTLGCVAPIPFIGSKNCKDMKCSIDHAGHAVFYEFFDISENGGVTGADVLLVGSKMTGSGPL